MFLPTLHSLFADRTRTFDGFPLALPSPAGLPSFTRSGQRLLSMLRLGISSATPCSAGPCGPASPAAAARDFNTEFLPATFPGQLRFCRLVGQSEFQSGADFGPSSHFSILISRFRNLRLFGGWIQNWTASKNGHFDWQNEWERSFLDGVQKWPH